MAKAYSKRKNTTYELFIAALSILAIINIFILYIFNSADVDGVVIIINALLSVIFLGDFLYRLFTAASKPDYFLRQYGWADLLSSIPFPQAKLLRTFQIFRTGRMMDKVGARSLMREFLGHRGSSALLTILFFMILVLEFGGMGILAAESLSPDANILDANDAVWYVYVSITTVGYGDRFPVTPLGRIVGVVVLATGVGLFGTLTGFLSNAFLAPAKKEEIQENAPIEANVEAPNTATMSSESALSGGSPPYALSTRLDELQELLAQQQQGQVALQKKLAEVEQLLLVSHTKLE